MKSYSIITLFINLLYFSCKNDDNGKIENLSINKTEDTNTSVFEKEKIEHPSNIATHFYLDSTSLEIFWNDFQKNVKNNNIDKVIQAFEFPIHAYYMVLFQYAHDCDTGMFIENEKKYIDFDITEKNVREYYNFIFSNVLKEIISQTSTKDLLQKGIRQNEKPWITYQFFPKDYKVKVKCSNDHSLIFHISKEGNEWKISIGGL